MPYVEAILSDSSVQIAIALVVVGFILVILRRPKSPVLRKRAISLLSAVCFGVLALWALRQEAQVLAGAIVSSAERPIAVPIKGTVRYVAPELAYRHESVMLVLLLCGLAFGAAYKLARVENEA